MGKVALCVGRNWCNHGSRKGRGRRLRSDGARELPGFGRQLEMG